MCGIGGVVRMGQSPIRRSQLEALLIGLEKRGRDSAGVALFGTKAGSIQVFKEDREASRFVKSDDFDKFMKQYLNPDTQIALVHTRLATVGTYKDNKNNHPIFKEKACIVHNGCVGNYKQVFTKKALTPICDTDSDIIRAIAEANGITHKTVRELGDVSGTVATAIIHNDEPGKLLLCRSGNPLEIALGDEYIYFASLRQPISIANMSWSERWGIWNHKRGDGIGWGVFPTDTAWMLDANDGGLKWHQEYKTAPYVWQGYSRGYGYDGGYGTGAWWDDKDVIAQVNAGTKGSGVVSRSTTTRVEISYLCQNCNQKTFVPKSLMHLAHKPKKLTCGWCKKSLTNKATKITRHVGVGEA